MCWLGIGLLTLASAGTLAAQEPTTPDQPSSDAPESPTVTAPQLLGDMHRALTATLTAWQLLAPDHPQNIAETQSLFTKWDQKFRGQVAVSDAAANKYRQAFQLLKEAAKLFYEDDQLWRRTHKHDQAKVKQANAKTDQAKDLIDSARSGHLQIQQPRYAEAAPEPPAEPARLRTDFSKPIPGGVQDKYVPPPQAYKPATPYPDYPKYPSYSGGTSDQERLSDGGTIDWSAWHQAVHNELAKRNPGTKLRALVRYTVTRDGRITQLSVGTSSRDPSFDQYAKDVVKSLEYNPALRFPDGSRRQSVNKSAWIGDSNASSTDGLNDRERQGR